MRLDHIGWITSQPDKFEDFWCGLLGYRKAHTGTIKAEMAGQLFGINQPAVIRRYTLDNMPTIEIHVFEGPSVGSGRLFQQEGINHICLHTGEKGSKEKFLHNLPGDITRHVYQNPGGWVNVFVRDYEGNWIELREDA